jgi:hypothetical protein
MKATKIYLSLLLLLIAIAGNVQTISAQSKMEKKAAKIAAIKNLVDSQAFVFYAESVTPMSGRLRNLTSEYTLDISKDKIISDLPYFGRAYSAPIGTDGGIKFSSVNFEYSIKDRKKGGWDIVIKPKDASDVQVCNLTVFDEGSASLQVTSTNRQPISFSGNIKAARR